MSQKNLLTKSALAAAVAIISSNVSAAGFQLNEFSSAGLGRAYSGEGAMADTAASASRNPALLMMYTRPGTLHRRGLHRSGRRHHRQIPFRRQSGCEKHRANRLGAEPALCSPD
ncbi:outer membrane protein transport protein [Serratia marcescens]|uniref:outer membrane protein transport protein n=1 Tax=Serratia marcescens TaxID=615 RepID=UPI003F49BCAF